MSARDLASALARDVINPDSILSAGEDFFILDSPKLASIDRYPFKTEWIIATFCEEGSASGRINLREFEVVKNGFIIIIPGQIIESVRVSPDFRGTMVLMSNRFSADLNIGQSFSLKSQIESQPYYLFPEAAVPAIRGFINMAKAMISVDASPSVIDALSHLSQAFFLGMGNYIMHQRPVRRNLSGSSELTEKFLNLVEREYRHHRDLDYYARELCRSAKHLSRTIKETSGKTATEWLEYYIVMDAKAQLRSSSKTIDEISFDLGFPSQSYFGKYFKRVTGLSPRAYRNAGYGRTDAGK